jgi:hypothetical protein
MSNRSTRTGPEGEEANEEARVGEKEKMNLGLILEGIHNRKIKRVMI